MSKRFHLLDGERRWRAAQLAGLKYLDCIVLTGPLTPANRALAQHSIDAHHLGHRPSERARALQDILRETGLTLTEACKQLGFSQTTGTKLISVRERLAPEILAKVDAGLVPFETGYTLSREPDHAKQLALLANAAEPPRGAAPPDRERAAIQAKASIVKLAMPGQMSVSVRGKDLILTTVIEVLAETVKQLKKALSQGLDVSTVEQVFKDTASARREKP